MAGARRSMAKQKIIAVDLKGPKSSRAQLSDFSTVCTSLHACLKNIGRSIGKKSPEFGISDLRMGSALMAVQPESKNGEGFEIASLFENTVTALEQGQQVDRRLDYAALHCFRGFAGIARSRESSLTIAGVTLSDSFADNLAALLDPISTALGSVSGKLEAFTVHRQRVFTLYPPMSQEEVDCSFNRSELARVLDAVDKQVTVYGTLHYAQSKIFPVRVDVDDFEIVDSDEKLPNLLDAKGMLPPLSADNPLLDRKFSDEWH